MHARLAIRFQYRGRGRMPYALRPGPVDLSTDRETTGGTKWPQTNAAFTHEMAAIIDAHYTKHRNLAGSRGGSTVPASCLTIRDALAALTLGSGDMQKAVD